MLNRAKEGQRFGHCRNFVAFKFVFLLLCSPVPTFAADDQWHWVKVGNNFDHAWDIYRGEAEVTINGQQFGAKLFWEDRSGVQLLLTGTIANGRLTVTETVNDSDVGKSIYAGTHTMSKWTVRIASGATGVETINLSNKLSMIGITRTIYK
ncbi:MAG TPA: hypothetical protein VKC66_26000 [Xanthobacteraceae bacterium]|nr:hypothetical protein [Xanthobacteraceae bacterium]